MHKRSDSERPNCDNTPHLGLAPTPPITQGGWELRDRAPPHVQCPSSSCHPRLPSIYTYASIYICKSSYLVHSEDVSDTLHTVYVCMYIRSHPGFTPHTYTTRLTTCSRWCERTCICRHRMSISQLACTGACTNPTPKPYCFVSTGILPNQGSPLGMYVCMYVCTHVCAETGKKWWRDSGRAGGARVMVVRVGFWT